MPIIFEAKASAYAKSGTAIAHETCSEFKSGTEVIYMDEVTAHADKGTAVIAARVDEETGKITRVSGELPEGTFPKGAKASEGVGANEVVVDEIPGTKGQRREEKMPNIQ